MHQRDNAWKSAATAENRKVSLPVIFIIGDQGSAKTSVVAHCGLDPELLAGQVFIENNDISTPVANFWYGRDSVFVEAAGKLPDAFERLSHGCEIRSPLEIEDARGPAARCGDHYAGIQHTFGIGDEEAKFWTGLIQTHLCLPFPITDKAAKRDVSGQAHMESFETERSV